MGNSCLNVDHLLTTSRTETPEQLNIALARCIATIQSEKLQLKAETLGFKEIDRIAADRLAEGLDERWSETEQRLQCLEVLLIAAERIKQVSDGQQFLVALHEVLSTLLGTEEFALYAKTATGIRRVMFIGDDTECSLAVNPPQMVGECAVSGTRMVSQEKGEPLLCEPLHAGHDLVGVLVINGLLPQKTGFTSGDLALLRLLSHFAGSAMSLYLPHDQSIGVCSAIQ